MAQASMIRWLRQRFRALIACALVPVGLLSGQPSYGCICADGHYEFFCRGSHGAVTHRESESTVTTTESTCSCCHKSSAAKASHDCCHGATDCCRLAQDPHQKTGQHVNSKGCCTPVVRDAIEGTLIASIQAIDDHHLPAQCAVIIEFPSVQVEAHPRPHLLSDTGPPPDDIVVTLRRLVI